MAVGVVHQMIWFESDRKDYLISMAEHEGLELPLLHYDCSELAPHLALENHPYYPALGSQVITDPSPRLSPMAQLVVMTPAP